MLKRARAYLLAFLITVFYGLLSRTWSFKHIRRERPEAGTDPRVFAHWHGDELLLIGAFVRSRMAIMASRSQDGEMLRHILVWLGYRVVRGSSSRGGAGGLKGLIDAVAKQGWDASLAVDGPRGPAFRVKPGILKLAQETGRPLIPGAAAASRRFVFKKAWNRCYLPLPFARCVIVYGEPVMVPQNISDEEFEALRRQLEEKLLALKSEAEGLFQRKPDFAFALNPNQAGV